LAVVAPLGSARRHLSDTELPGTQTSSRGGSQGSATEELLHAALQMLSLLGGCLARRRWDESRRLLQCPSPRGNRASPDSCLASVQLALGVGHPRAAPLPCLGVKPRLACCLLSPLSLLEDAASNPPLRRHNHFVPPQMTSCAFVLAESPRCPVPAAPNAWSSVIGHRMPACHCGAWPCAHDTAALRLCFTPTSLPRRLLCPTLVKALGEKELC